MTDAMQTLVWTGTALFGIGLLGLVIRRNMLILLMCVELMLSGANLVLITYSRVWGDQAGQILALVVIAIAAAEAGIGLGIILRLFRQKDSLDLDRFRLLRN